MQNLIKEAIVARKFAYCPYSRFQVGAALLDKNGKIYRGCNVENVSFTVGLCAERNAISKAISEGVRDYQSIAIVADSTDSTNITTPCGACRQFILEFGNLNVYCTRPNLDKVLTIEAKELLPYAFENLRIK